MKMCLALVGSTATAPIERPLDTGGLPGTKLQDLPVSVDLYRPTPASESLEPLGSPVPAYSVLADESFGSNAREPIAFDGMPLPDGFQLGRARASSATHTPPPAVPAKSLQLLPLQPGGNASEVTRPET